MKKFVLLFVLPLTFAGCQEDEISLNENQTTEFKSDFTDLKDSLSSTIEIIILNTSVDTLITCAKGTKLYFEKNSFTYPNGKLASGSINLQIKECYSLADFISEDLTTTSNGEILESGGMIHIQVTDENDSILILKEGAEYGLFFPKESKSEDMYTFYGDRNEDSVLDWTIAPVSSSPVQTVQPANPGSLISLSCKLAITSYTTQIGKKSVDWKFQNQPGDVYTYFDSIFDKTNDTFNFMCGTDQSIELTLTIDKNGDVVKLFFVQSTNPQADSIVSSFIQNLPLFDMTKMGDSWTSDNFNLGFSAQNVVDHSEYKSAFEEQYKSFKDKAVEQVPQAELNYYVLSATQMGWINCDRFWNTEAPKEDFFVSIDSQKETSVYLVFREIRSLMNGKLLNSKMKFDKIPIGSSVKLIGIQYNGGKPFMAIANTTTKNQDYKLDNFKEFTLDELEQELNSIY